MYLRRSWPHLRFSYVSYVLFAAVILGACGGGPTPAPASTNAESTVSASPTASQTSSPTYKPADAKGRAQNVPVPVLPEAAKAETKEGLLAFGRYWFDQLNYAYETGNVAGFAGISFDTCEYCSNLRRSLQSGYNSGRWVTGGRLTQPSIETNFLPSDNGNYEVFVQVQQEEIKYFEPGAREYRKPTPKSDSGVVMLVVFKDGAFQLVSMHPLQ